MMQSTHYKKILKDGAEVEPCALKFQLLHFKSKCSLVEEEIMVMAYERFRKLGYYHAYTKMLKKFIINHAPIWEAKFIIENYIAVEKPSFDYYKKIENNKNQQKMEKQEVLEKFKEVINEVIESLYDDDDYLEPTEIVEKHYNRDEYKLPIFNETFGEIEILEVPGNNYGIPVIIFHFKEHNTFIKLTGDWNSYSNKCEYFYTENGYANDVNYSLVEPKEKTITIYE